MPIDLRLTAAPAPAGSPLAVHLTALAGVVLGRRLGPDRVTLTAATPGRPAAAVRAFAEGLLLGAYRFSLGSAPAASGGPGGARILIAEGDDRAAEAVTAARTAAVATGLARDLANMPSGGYGTPLLLAWLGASGSSGGRSAGLAPGGSGRSLPRTGTASA